jgi:hypothetical protein
LLEVRVGFVSVGEGREGYCYKILWVFRGQRLAALKTENLKS